MAKARDIPQLSEPLSFREAAGAALEVRSAEVWEHEQRALDTADIEGVHDMRVATRRLRAVMEIFEPCFPEKRHRRALKEVKALADVLGERRDPDVMIDRLREVGSELTQEDAPGLESLIEALRENQLEANERLERKLVEVRDEHVRERLELLAAEVRP